MKRNFSKRDGIEPLTSPALPKSEQFFNQTDDGSVNGANPNGRLTLMTPVEACHSRLNCFHTTAITDTFDMRPWLYAP